MTLPAFFSEVTETVETTVWMQHAQRSPPIGSKRLKPGVLLVTALFAAQPFYKETHMNARIEALQLATTPTIASLTKPWLQRLHALNQPTASTEVSDDALQDLLKQCRLELSGVFSREDLFILLNGMFQRRHAPNELHRLATDICHDLGVEIDEAEQSSLWPLLERLFSLTRGQSVALCDALQLALTAEDGPVGCWKGLGIEVRED
jgi:hypothetical protein